MSESQNNNPIERWHTGAPGFVEKANRQLDEIERRTGKGPRSPNQVPTTPRPPSPLTPFRVTGVENDYLVCTQIGGAETEGVLVAKVPELRHDEKYYDGVSSITTNDAQEIDVSFTDSELDDEVWIVHPPFLADVSGKSDTVIWAVRSSLAGDVEVDEEPLEWQMMPDARAWALNYEED